MLFNSSIFIAFFVSAYALYLLLRWNSKLQNVLLLLASYVFYGYWDWRFLSLIAVSTLTDFFVGRRLYSIEDSTSVGKSQRKLLLSCSIAVNLTLLGLFKYFNFFAESLASFLGFLGIDVAPIALNIILPVGISFYTLKTMSYTVDIYRKRLKPTNSLLNFAVFVAFFPQLMAGPIERAVNMLPQIENPRRITVEQLDTGFFLVLWGYFKKMVVADNVGLVADRIFNNYTDFVGLDILIGVLAFSVQLYADFSGYSDIARGISRLMGFELMVNFRLPQFSLNPADFWNRWHISLSYWLRDYIFYPLRRTLLQSSRSTDVLSLVLPPMVTMLASGLWHGPNWTFVLWGMFHGSMIIAYQRFERQPVHQDPWGGKYSFARVIGKMTVMFVLTHIGWLIFRATTVHQIGYMLTNISPALSTESTYLASKLLFFGLPLLLVQIYQYSTGDLLILTRLRGFARVPVYSFLLIWILIFGLSESMEFIYFQF